LSAEKNSFRDHDDKSEIFGTQSLALRRVRDDDRQRERARELSEPRDHARSSYDSGRVVGRDRARDGR
jgi:hypothetical protein